MAPGVRMPEQLPRPCDIRLDTRVLGASVASVTDEKHVLGHLVQPHADEVRGRRKQQHRHANIDRNSAVCALISIHQSVRGRSRSSQATGVSVTTDGTDIGELQRLPKRFDPPRNLRSGKVTRPRLLAMSPVGEFEPDLLIVVECWRRA